MKSKNPTVLVTGSSQRIGAAIIRKFHAHGLDVAIHYRNARDEAHSLESELNAIRSHSARVFRTDLLLPKAIARLGQCVIDHFGRLDVLINNASIFRQDDHNAPGLAEQLFGVHVQAPNLLTEAVANALRKTNGSVINITDIYAQRPLRGYSLYCASKAALESLTKSQAVMLAPEIRVNAIAPGAILWPENSKTGSKKVIDNTPLQRVGKVSEIADAAVFLALFSKFTTGQVLVVDGGRSVVEP